ncbi:MAG: Endonuclease/Exonuclease/phosphatase family [Acidimicrobiales bacterium]|nr:Endonuclease/Exonuclease/phosphatase family [Acidimicrobiales bacterium]
MAAGGRGRRCLAVAALAASLVASCADDDGDRADPASRTTEVRAPGDGDLRLVGLNVLHGVLCTDGDHCDAPERVELLARQLEAARCPDVVALQEISPWMHDLVEGRAETLCGGRYEIVFPPIEGAYIDVEMVLTTLPARDARREVLAQGFRRALRVTLESRTGPVDLVVTHTGTGAGSDSMGGGPPCAGGRSACPPPCDPDGTVSACQITQVAELVDGRPTEDRTAGVLVGDLNLVPEAPPVRALLERGWVDSFVAAGNPACDPATSVGCTGGRDDATLASLRDPTSRERERIDYALVSPGACEPAFDTPDDGDGDGLGTGLFADEPAVDGPAGLAWPSDHVGVALDLSCR